MLTRILTALGVAPDADQVGRSVAACRFGLLADREASVGFPERAHRDRSVFRRGQADGCREELTPEQIGRIVGIHGPVMRRLGYGASLEGITAWD